jgi:molecular chaperone DnaK
MCGGADFDRAIVDAIVSPWLTKRFSLPEDYAARAKYKILLSMAAWAAEKSKICLSSRENMSRLFSGNCSAAMSLGP